jgi:7-keto-8-aminopelargonate synthetase-like enzyme
MKMDAPRNHDLIAGVQVQLDELLGRSLLRKRRQAESPAAPRQIVDGRSLLAFCSNDYLGLAAHPRVVEALREGATLYGAGSGASHLVSGHSRAHALLEDALAAFEAPHLEQARALYFCTGYMANLAVLTALGDRADAMIFSEALNHASLIDGARLARARVSVYPHGDVRALEAQLIASDAPVKIVVTDSVFSMDGDLAPLPALLGLCERHGAWLVVDDAHGFGVLGRNGRARWNISVCARPTWSTSARWARRPASAAPSLPRTSRWSSWCCSAPGPTSTPPPLRRRWRTHCSPALLSSRETKAMNAVRRCGRASPSWMAH